MIWQWNQIWGAFTLRSLVEWIGNARAPPRMSFPPELIDHILKSLRDDPKSLSAASLVSKAWTSWGQAYLFESVHLTPANLPTWLEVIPPEVDGLASHTRTLTLEEYRLLPWINPQNLDFPFSHLASFRNVRSLALVQWNATLFHGASPEPYFGHFGKTLRTLSLRFCTLDPASLFNLLSLLPNLQDLEVAYLFPCSGPPNTIPDTPKVTPSFRGTLSLADLGSGHLILKAIAALPLHFTTVNIRACTFYEPEAYQTLLTGCRESLVVLSFDKSYRGALGVYPGDVQPVLTLIPPDRPVPEVSLASCDKLEEVHALLRSNKHFSRSLLGLLSSITSKKLRKISLTFVDFSSGVVSSSHDEDEDEDDWDDEEDGTATWSSFDETLSHLAKQVAEVGGNLTLRLKIRCFGDVPVKFDHLLNQFSEDGELDLDVTRIGCQRVLSEPAPLLFTYLTRSLLGSTQRTKSPSHKCRTSVHVFGLSRPHDVLYETIISYDTPLSHDLHIEASQ